MFCFLSFIILLSFFLLPALYLHSLAFSVYPGFSLSFFPLLAIFYMLSESPRHMTYDTSIIFHHVVIVPLTYFPGQQHVCSQTGLDTIF